MCHWLKKFNSEWIDNFYTVFSNNGMAVLGFWLMSLFVSQIKEKHESFTFIELTGEPSTGKTTLLVFLWSLLGRVNEGVDPERWTPAGMARLMAQASNMPFCLIEGDRDDSRKQKRFDWGELKSLYNLNSSRGIGLKTEGLETKEMPFRGSVLIAQNASIDAEPAVMERIVHLHATKKHHTQTSRELAPPWFNRQKPEEMAGFLYTALSNEKQILKQFDESFAKYDRQLFAMDEIKTSRVAKCHAQIMAGIDCLEIVFPNINKEQVSASKMNIVATAVRREKRLVGDSPLLEKFWSQVEYMESLNINLNHRKDNADKNTYAINLNHFKKKSRDEGQEFIELSELKKRA